MYEVVVQREGGGALPKGHTTYTLALDSYGKFVRHILLGYTLSGIEARDYVSTCPNLQDIALWTQRLSPALVHQLGQLENLQRLSTNIERLFRASTAEVFGGHDFDSIFNGPTHAFDETGLRVGSPFFHLTFGHPLFRNVTHLELTNICEGAWSPRWCGLAQLPRLTHLAFDFEFNDVVIEGCLDECQSLRVLVLLNGVLDPFGNKLREMSARIAGDPRVVPHVVKSFSNDWEEGARGKADFWKCAEEIVEERLRPRPVLLQHATGTN
ncbi:hypothetical protein BDN72DRAFT_846332 [Pluteus cervinus]|uniref:Uncharacterized protein n=1 Tax=Pluteus cervinus TaxID=181527 RepID=A0ACD3AFN1_9AGAR|nr:hypothetical protein BDN72DRAFT_846332 [Pluteus cervinus]